MTERNPSGPSSQPQVRVDWPAFLRDHDLLWERIGNSWYEGLFAGNGLLGTMVYREPDTPDQPGGLRFDIGRADIYDRQQTDRRQHPLRVPIGRFVLVPAGAIRHGSGRLDLHQAEVRGQIRTSNGTIAWRCLVPMQEEVALVEARATGDETVRFDLRLDNPSEVPVRYDQKGDTQTALVTHGDGTTFAVAWCQEEPAAGGRRLWFSVGNHPGKNQVSMPPDWRTGMSPEKEALTALDRARSRERTELVAAHRAWWDRYYRRSFVQLPDPDMDSYYWIQVYKFACASQPKRPLLDNLGPWSTHTVYAFHTWDLNVQATHEVPFTINRAELAEPLIDFMRRRVLESPERKQPWAAISHASSFEARLDVCPTRQPSLPAAYGGSANLVWACYDLWLAYRHSLDDRLATEVLLPVLEVSVNGMTREERLQRRPDGTYGLWHCRSPEYPAADQAIVAGEGGAVNSNYELALLRWGLSTLLQLTVQFQPEHPRRAEWQEILTHLPPFPCDANGYRIDEGLPVEVGHRHYSHLMMLYPLHLLDPLDPAHRATVERSLQHWLELPEDKKGRTGYTYTGAICNYATLGDGETCCRYLRAFLEGTARHEHPIVQPNTFYRELGPVFETPVLFLQAVSYMLLQSWRDYIEVFPAVPARWPDVGFADLSAQGGFRVSACREQALTRWVRVRSDRGGTCRIKPNFGSGTISAAPAGRFVLLDGGLCELEVPPGGEVLLFTGRMPGDWQPPACPSPNPYRIGGGTRRENQTGTASGGA